jgi:hypothetical protein
MRLAAGGRTRTHKSGVGEFTAVQVLLSKQVRSHTPRRRANCTQCPVRTDSGPILVESQGIVCDGVSAEGAPCGQVARILTTKHLYAAVTDDRGNVEHVLWQTHYDLHCPQCGSRRIIVCHGEQPL